MRSQWSACLGLICLHAFAAAAPGELSPIRLPITIAQSNPVTTIAVGGRSLQAIVDTGGDVDGVLSLSKEVIDSVGAVRLDTVVTNDGFGNEFSRPRFRVPVADIGGQTFRNIVVIQTRERPAAEGPAVPNAIGRNLLSQYFVVVDYAAGAITLWPPGTKDPPGIDCGRIRIPMVPTQEDRLAVSEFETPSGPVKLGWDTGAQYSTLSETTVARLKLPTALRGPNSPPFYQSKTLSASGQNIGPLEFVVLPLKIPKDFEGMLGRNFFENHLVCFDYQRREVRVRSGT